MTQSIMVVDDDQSIRDIVVEILADEGYRVRGFSNGMEALHSLESEQPALIVLDMRMPVLNGWEFAQQMRERGYDIPILVMTAAQDARAWAQEVQAIGYIAKPFEVDALIKAVGGVIGASGGDNRGNSTLSLRWPQIRLGWRHASSRVVYRSA